MAEERTAPSSFSKSLFFGHIPEQMVIPYPRLADEERALLKKTVEEFRAFAAAEIDSKAIEADERIPERVLKGLAGLGWFGLAIGKEYGGLGLSVTAFARAMQELAAHDSSVSLTLAAHQSIGSRGLVLFG